MNGCGCNYWKELIKSAWGLATTSVRAVKTKTDTKYPDGDGLIDLSDITGGGGEGTVTSVNSKQPDTQGNVTLGSGDISTPDGTVQGDIEELGTNLASEISARTSGDEALQTAVDGKQDVLTTAQLNAVNSGITKDKVTAYSMTTQNLTRLSNRVDTIEDTVDTKQDKLTAGANITISEDNVISATGGGSSGVSSVNGKTGTVTIGASDVLTTAQLNAANSGITSAKVTSYDGYASGKQDKLTAGSNITISEDNVISATGSSSGAVESVNGKTGKVVLSGDDIYANDDTVTAELAKTITGITTEERTTGLNLKLYHPDSTFDYAAIPTASASSRGVVRVGSGLSISNGVLSVTGGGGGASLPENGYYWEKITEDNWPTDWATNDTIMINIPYMQINTYDSPSSWTSTNYSTDPVSSSYNNPVIMGLGTNQIYYAHFKAEFVNFNWVKSNSIRFWNVDDLNTTILNVRYYGFNGAMSTNHSISDINIIDAINFGIWRLRKFSS